MPNTEPIAYRALYEEGVSKLSQADPEGRINPDAKLDARILLEEACGTDYQTLLLDPKKEIAPNQAALYRSFLERRFAHEPVAYIIGHWAFMGLDFTVTDDVLIPEQDTETLVELALEEIPRLLSLRETEDKIQAAGEPSNSFRVLDLCTGSGCILVSTLKLAGEDRRNNAVFTGVGADLSTAALEIARKNGDANGVNDKITWLQGDLWEALNALPKNERQFDLILTNPPYIAPSVIETLAPEVRDAEPRLALDGGEDGLDFYRRIADGIKPYLKKHSSIIVETGFDEAPLVQALFEQQGFSDIRIYKDMGDLERGIVVRS